MGEVHPSSNFLLLAASLAITFFVFPSLLNLPSQIFPSLAVEKSWDFLILALVVLAITYGFLSISNHVGDGRWLGSYGSSDTQQSSLSNPLPLSECYDSDDHGRVYQLPLGSFGTMIGSGRFPNLRAQDEGRRGHHDHTHLDVVRGSGSKTVHSRGRKKGDRNEEAKQFQSKEVIADDYWDRNAAVKEKRTYHPLEEKSKKKRDGLATNESSGSLKTKKKDRGRERIENSESLPVSQPQDKGRRGHHDHTHLDVVQGSGSKTVHSRGRRKGDRNEEARQFQSKEVIADDYCDRNAAVKEKRTCHPLEEKSKEKRGGLATNESSGSLKTKKKDRGRERIENSESLPVSQPRPSSSHQPLPGIDTPFTHKKGKKMADLAAPLPPAAPHKKKSHASVTVTPNYESSDDSPNSSGWSPSMPPPRPNFKVGPWLFAMIGSRVLIKSPKALRHKSPDAENYEDSVPETTENDSYGSLEATSPASCLGPDTDSNAEKFISTIKALQTLEGMNSRKQRRSTLGPEVIG